MVQLVQFFHKRRVVHVERQNGQDAFVVFLGWAKLFGQPQIISVSQNYFCDLGFGTSRERARTWKGDFFHPKTVDVQVPFTSWIPLGLLLSKKVSLWLVRFKRRLSKCVCRAKRVGQLSWVKRPRCHRQILLKSLKSFQTETFSAEVETACKWGPVFWATHGKCHYARWHFRYGLRYFSNGDFFSTGSS